MKNKVVKGVVAILLIIAITMADFVMVGMNLITYALENVDDNTDNENIKFAAYFETEEGDKAQTEYEMNDSQMKLYLKLAVKNSGSFENGTITLSEDSNFKIKQEQENLSEYVSSISGNTIALNRVMYGNEIQIELDIEPVIGESYEVKMLSQKSIFTLKGDYIESTEETTTPIEANKEVTLSLVVPSTIDTTLTGNVITNKTYKIGEANKKMVQLELNSSVVENAYPIGKTTFEINLPEGVEQAQVITKGTYATNGQAEREIKDYTWDKENKLLQVTIENTETDGKISWQKDASDNLIVTLILAENAELQAEGYNATAKVYFQGEETAKEKSITYIPTESIDGIIGVSITTTEEIYKGKIYSKEDREYNTRTDIEVNYADLAEQIIINESASYLIPEMVSEVTTMVPRAANIQYKTTTISKAELVNILGEEGTITIKDGSGNALEELSKEELDAIESENIEIQYSEGIKTIQIVISKAEQTGILRLNHTKVIKAETYTEDEIKEITHLTELAQLTYNVQTEAIEKTEESTITLHEVTSEAVITVEPNSVYAEQTNEMQIAITLKTDHEKYKLFNSPTFTITMPEGVTINRVSDGTGSSLYDGLAISKLEKVDAKTITIELTGAQTEYVESNINSQINFTANVSVEKFMANKVGNITMQYTNGGAAAGIKYKEINVNASNEKIVTHLQVENYDGQGAAIEKYSDSSAEVKGELPIENTAVIEVPVKYTIINNYNSTITAIAIIESDFIDNKGNETDLINYSETGIEIAAGQMKAIEKTIQIPASLYYNNQVEIRTALEYSYSGTEYKVTNNIELATEENEGIRDTSIIDDKLKVKTYAQLGDGTGIKDTDEVYNEQIITYVIEVTNISDQTISNIQVTNTQENGNIYDLKEVEAYNPYTGLNVIEHEYAELDTNVKTFEKIEDLAPGESIELICRVVAKKSAESNITTANISLSADEIEQTSIPTISNNVIDSTLKITTKKALAEDLQMYTGASYLIETIIENLTDKEINNIDTKVYLSDGLTFKEDGEGIVIIKDGLEAELLNGEAVYNEEENYIECEISKLEANESIILQSWLYIEEMPLAKVSKETNVYAEINDIISNSVTTIVQQLKTKLSISQYVNIGEEEKLKDGETVILTAKIKNLGSIDSTININSEINNALTINKITMYQNGEAIDQTSKGAYNILYITTTLNPQEEITLEIEATLKIENLDDEVEKIENVFIASPYQGDSVESNVITIYVEREEEEKENVGGLVKPDENKETFTISGQVWADKNKDQIKDSDENIEGVIVKVVDANNLNNYLKDENGQEVEAITNSNGQYIIEGVTKGEYNIIFKYDTNVYETTKDYFLENTQEKVAMTDAIYIEEDQTIDLQLLLKAEEPDNPDNPDNPDDPEKPEVYSISGNVWVDKNKNNIQDSDEAIEGVIVKAIDINNKNTFLTDDAGKEIESVTDKNGKYTIKGIKKGTYNIIFKYDTSLYELKTDADIKDYIIESTKEKVAITKEINLSEDAIINLQLMELTEFNLKIDKYISKVIVKTTNETKTSEYMKKQLVKEEIQKKYLTGATILVEYTLDISNIGELAGYATEIKDYLPSDMKFHSELNKQWYIGEDGNIYNTSLASSAINPGETQTIKLVLIKTMSEENIGTTSNKAEISKTMNIKEYNDIDSSDNQSIAEIIVNPATGEIITYSIAILSGIAIIVVGIYIIKKKIIK